MGLAPKVYMYYYEFKEIFMMFTVKKNRVNVVL
jgi:hypothetical protein